MLQSVASAGQLCAEQKVNLVCVWGGGGGGVGGGEASYRSLAGRGGGGASEQGGRLHTFLPRTCWLKLEGNGSFLDLEGGKRSTAIWVYFRGFTPVWVRL